MRRPRWWLYAVLVFTSPVLLLVIVAAGYMTVTAVYLWRHAPPDVDPAAVPVLQAEADQLWLRSKQTPGRKVIPKADWPSEIPHAAGIEAGSSTWKLGASRGAIRSRWVVCN